MKKNLSDVVQPNSWQSQLALVSYWWHHCLVLLSYILIVTFQKLLHVNEYLLPSHHFLQAWSKHPLGSISSLVETLIEFCFLLVKLFLIARIVFGLFFNEAESPRHRPGFFFFFFFFLYVKFKPTTCPWQNFHIKTEDKGESIGGNLAGYYSAWSVSIKVPQLSQDWRLVSGWPVVERVLVSSEWAVTYCLPFLWLNLLLFQGEKEKQMVKNRCFSVRLNLIFQNKWDTKTMYIIHSN